MDEEIAIIRQEILMTDKMMEKWQEELLEEMKKKEAELKNMKEIINKQIKIMFYFKVWITPVLSLVSHCFQFKVK